MPVKTVRFNALQTRVVAHRGLSGIETENTAAAFVAAGNRERYFGIETDLYRTRDGRFIVHHDAGTGRLSEFDLDIERTNFAELRRLTLAKSGTARCDARLPSLEEYADICKCYDKHCVLELKSDFTVAELEAIVGILREREWLDKVIFISFNLDCLIRLRGLLPAQKIQYLSSVCEDGLPELLNRHRFDLDLYYEQLTEQMLHRLHAMGIEVNVWTVDDPAAAERLCAWGVDYLTSNLLEPQA